MKISKIKQKMMINKMFLQLKIKISRKQIFHKLNKFPIFIQAIYNRFVSISKNRKDIIIIVNNKKWNKILKS